MNSASLLFEQKVHKKCPLQPTCRAALVQCVAHEQSARRKPRGVLGRTQSLQGSRPSQKWVSPPIFGQEARQNWLPQGGDSGTNILQRPEWSRKNTPIEYVWVFTRRLGPGLAGVGKVNPPQKLKTKIVSAPIHSTGMEWCGKALCKCTQIKRQNV